VVVITLDQKKALIVDFLQKCNSYSDEVIEKYRKRICDSAEIELNCEKIRKWAAYREFNEVAIREIQAADLDHWFEETDVRE
jgi:hypothetical protein